MPDDHDDFSPGMPKVIPVFNQDPHRVRELSERNLELAIGREVRACRRQQGMTVADLAGATGLSIGMLSKIENGITSPSLTTLQILAHAFSTPITSFFRRFEERSEVQQVKAGDHIVSARALFGSCFQVLTNILPRFGVKTTLVDGSDLDAWREAITPGTKCVFIETPSNPMLEAIDIAAVAESAHKAGARVVVDNIFATPVLQKPLTMGADVIVYSGTKHMDGQGRVLGGAIMSTEQFKEEELKPFLRHTGPSLSPFNAWVLLKGLETMKLRVNAQSAAALRVAQMLEENAGVARVLYPYLDSHPQAELCRKLGHWPGTQFTCFTSTKVQLLKERRPRRQRCEGVVCWGQAAGTQFACFTWPSTCL